MCRPLDRAPACRPGEVRVEKTQVADRQRLLALHDEVVRQNLAAREVLTLLLLTRCSQILKRERPFLDPTVVSDVVEDAVLHYLSAPERYEPSRAGLDTFILHDARYRILHAIRSDQRRRRRDSTVTRGDPAAVPEPDTEGDRNDGLLAILIPKVANGRERAFLEAKAHGERRTSALAEILGLPQLSASDKRRAVKRVADKLLLRLRRLVKSASGPK
jgi:RNA polymerase sigma factor (sigma-70 family)